MILCIETSTDICSVALINDGQCIASLQHNTNNQHAATLTPLIEQLLKEQNITTRQLKAVAVSSGPGSYTGLRIGVSTAKGICYALSIPLISINSLHIIAQAIFDAEPDAQIAIPMIDARRMEVYAETIKRNGEIISDTEAVIINENSFADILKQNDVFFGGNGSEKCNGVINSANARFISDIKPLAKNMAQLAQDKFNSQQFESVAYFEPFYLKEFVATVPKNKVIQ